MVAFSLKQISFVGKGGVIGVKVR